MAGARKKALTQKQMAVAAMEVAKDHGAAEAGALTCEAFAERYCKIADKRGVVVPFKLNRVQRLLVRRIEAQKRTRGFVRMIVVKPRQVGSSAVCEMVLAKEATTRTNYRCVTIAHDEPTAKILFEYAAGFVRGLPEGMRPKERGNPGKHEIDMTAPDSLEGKEREGYLGSRMMVRFASAPILGHGLRFNAAHLSEVAYYSKMPGADETEIMKGIENTIPLRGDGTIVLMESTGRGMAGLHYTRYQSAVKGESDYEAFFAPWMLHEEYAIEGTGLKAADVTDDEAAIRGEIVIAGKRVEVRPTLSNLAWRRAKLREIEDRSESMQDPLEEFQQQYPATDQEAFVAEGGPVFPAAMIEVHRRRISEEKPSRQVRLSGGWRTVEVSDARGPGTVRVWQEPRSELAYVIGADVAQSQDRRADYSCAQVLERRTLDQVACLIGRFDPDVFADKTALLAGWYGRARIAVEDNNCGPMVIRRLQELGYGNLYTRKTLNQIGPGLTERIGWHTDRQSRPLLFQDMLRCLRTGTTIPHDLELLRELSVFTWDDNGQPTAGNSHDDRAFAYMIAIQCQRQIGAGRSPDEVEAADKRRMQRWVERMVKGSNSGFSFVLGCEA